MFVVKPCYVQTPKVLCKLKGKKRRGYERTYSETVSQVHAQRRVLRVALL